MPWRPRSAGNRSRASLPALIKSRTGVVRHCEAVLAPRSRSSSVLTPSAPSASLASSTLRAPSTAPGRAAPAARRRRRHRSRTSATPAQSARTTARRRGSRPDLGGLGRPGRRGRWPRSGRPRLPAPVARATARSARGRRISPPSAASSRRPCEHLGRGQLAVAAEAEDPAQDRLARPLQTRRGGEHERVAERAPQPRLVPWASTSPPTSMNTIRSQSRRRPPGPGRWRSLPARPRA